MMNEFGEKQKQLEKMFTQLLFHKYELSTLSAVSMVLLEAEEIILSTTDMIFTHTGLSLEGETHFNKSLHE